MQDLQGSTSWVMLKGNSAPPIPWGFWFLKTKMAKIDTLFKTKRLNNHTLWVLTYLYSPYKVIVLTSPHPRPPGVMNNWCQQKEEKSTVQATFVIYRSEILFSLLFLFFYIASTITFLAVFHRLFYWRNYYGTDHSMTGLKIIIFC